MRDRDKIVFEKGWVPYVVMYVTKEPERTKFEGDAGYVAVASDYEVKRVGATTEIKELRVEDFGYKIGQYEELKDEQMEDIDNENTLEAIMTYRDYTNKARGFKNYEFYAVKDCEGAIIVNKKIKKIAVKNYKRYLSVMFEKDGVRVLLVGYFDQTK